MKDSNLDWLTSSLASDCYGKVQPRPRVGFSVQVIKRCWDLSKSTFLFGLRATQNPKPETNQLTPYWLRYFRVLLPDQIDFLLREYSRLLEGLWSRGWAFEKLCWLCPQKIWSSCPTVPIPSLLLPGGSLFPVYFSNQPRFPPPGQIRMVHSW